MNPKVQLPTKAELEAQRTQLLAERFSLIAAFEYLILQTKEKARGVR